MAERWHDEPWAKGTWWSGKTTRRRFLGFSVATAGALGATMLVPAPWRTAFGQAKPYKVGTLQPLSGTAAAGGKTALVGVQMAVDRVNKAGGLQGRPIELVIADYESKPDVGRRKAEKLVVEDKIDAHVGGYLSNVCLACMPVYEEHKIVNMIGVCLDTTITTTKCSRYTFRPFDYAPAQAVAFAPYLVGKLGKKWHIAYLDYAWGQSTRDAYAEQIKKAGGSAADAQHFAAEMVGRYEQDRQAWPAIALTTDTSALTAVGNDYGFDRVFARQIEALGRAGAALADVARHLLAEIVGAEIGCARALVTSLLIRLRQHARRRHCGLRVAKVARRQIGEREHPHFPAKLREVAQQHVVREPESTPQIS